MMKQDIRQTPKQHVRRGGGPVNAGAAPSDHTAVHGWTKASRI